MYQERYFFKVQPTQAENSALVFGKVFHGLCEARLKGVPVTASIWEGVPQEIRDEAEYTFEAYCQQYPTEDWEVLDVEKLVEVPIPESEGDVYVGKLDVIIRRNDNGQLGIVDHKTEERGSYSNSLQRW